ncbi:MAG: glycosyltransferase family 2 protein [Clostridia bacterium]|nr:glycosyltransferase family 2 protein [Clostridia bacterium]MBQ8893207.1 glycosyltransferase family 2 protein [Clostridia bacterium]
MLISIIIPVYNTKDYLEKCVSSVLACDYSDCEILLIDDGSTDGETPALCDAIAERDPAIRVIHQQNKGLGGARNTGIEEATGEYLFFIDSDDTIVPQALELLKKEISRTHAEIYSFNMTSKDDNENRSLLITNYYESETSFSLAEHPEYMQSVPSACCRIWKKSLYTENEIYFPERVWYEDIRTTVKLFALASSIVTLKSPLYIYYMREGSIMHSANLDRSREIIDAFEDLLGWYREKGLFEQYKEVLCRLCIEHVYLTASVRVLRGDRKHPLLKEFADYLKRNFPDYKKADLSFLPAARRLVFRLLEWKQYALIMLLFKIKS